MAMKINQGVTDGEPLAHPRKLAGVRVEEDSRTSVPFWMNLSAEGAVGVIRSFGDTQVIHAQPGFGGSVFSQDLFDRKW